MKWKEKVLKKLDELEESVNMAGFKVKEVLIIIKGEKKTKYGTSYYEVSGRVEC